MTVSVNTNPGAMIALQNLNKSNMELQQVQNRINTGLSVSGAKDNGGIFAIAQRMRADVSAYGVVQQSLDRGDQASYTVGIKLIILMFYGQTVLQISPLGTCALVQPANAHYLL